MKYRILKAFVVFLGCVLWLAGCYPDKFNPESDDVGPLPTLEFSEASVEFRAVGDCRLVTVTTNYKTCRVDVPDEAAGWCHVSVDGMTLNIAVDENTGSRERSTAISVSVAHGVKELIKTVAVFQAGTLPQIKHSPSQLIYEQEEVGEQVLKVTTNQDRWEFEKKGDWFTVEREGDVLKVKPAGKNENAETRKGYITLISSGEGEGKTARVSVLLEQLGSDPALRLTENVFSLSPEGGVFRSRVVTNQSSWKIYRGAGEWYEARAEKDEVVLTVGRNIGGEARKTEIVVASGNDKIFENISVAQLGTGLSLEVSADTVRVNAAESFATLWVTTNADEWTASVTGGDGWCELMEDADKLTVYAKANTSAERGRECIVTVKAGNLRREVRVIQAPDMMLVLNHDTLRYEPDAGVQDVLVMTNQAEWTVEVPDSISAWCSVSREANVLSVSVTSNRDANRETRVREGVITVKAGDAEFEKRRVLQVVQKGMIPLLTIDSAALHCLSVETCKEVALQANIPWNVVKNATWLEVSPAEGEGNALLNFLIKENESVGERVDTVRIQGGAYTREVIVRQSGAAPVLTVDVDLLTCPAEQTDRVLNITSNTFWEVSGLPSWVTVNQRSGTGNFALKLTLAAYTGIQERECRFKVSIAGVDREIRVVQRGVAPVLTLSPESLSVSSAGERKTVAVTSNVGWTFTGMPSWMTLDKSSGTGTTNVILSVKENESIQSREVELTVSNEYLTRKLRVTQAGATPVLSVDSMKLNCGASGGDRQLKITSNMNWQVTGLPAWITASPEKGKGDGIVTLKISANEAAQKRESVLTISGEGVTRKISVTQLGLNSLLPGGDVEDWDKGDVTTGDMVTQQQERDLLIEFYYEMNGDDWVESTNWKSRRPLSEWKGVTTDAEGFVTGLELAANNLSGHLTALLSKLSRLSNLNLSGNRITGTIPPAIRQMKGYDKSKIAPQRDDAGNVVYLTEE